MSAFTDLLTEADAILRARYRSSVLLHFDWDPSAQEARTWSAWYRVDRAHVCYGRTGEEALRLLVESMR